jgi:hypothetical protein
MAEHLFELRRRTFDTPHFRGITFIESEAKSIINHVPGNYLPFNWTTYGHPVGTPGRSEGPRRCTGRGSPRAAAGL